MKSKRLAIFAWIVLGYTILVILMGALVRATGSGAGCGAHWPLCDGAVIPRADTTEQQIEFAHRLTSSLNGILVIILLIWSFRAYPKRHIVRKGAVLSLVFIIIEGLVGAALVRFELVGDNSSTARAVVIALHLVNTFILLAVLTLTAWWSSGEQPIRWRGQPAKYQWLLLLGIFGMLALGTSGAITALGDTLFPPTTILEGLQDDFAGSSHILLRLRVWHPGIAIGMGLYVWLAGRYLAAQRPSRHARRFSQLLFIIFVAQFAMGFINLILRVPVATQLLHLLLADLVWIVFILLGASVLAVAPEPATQTESAALLTQTGD